MHLPDFSAYDNISQPIFVLVQNLQGQVVYGFLNRFGCDILGLPPEDVVGRPACELFDGRAGDSVLQRQTIAWEEGKAASYDVALPIRDQKYWVRTTLQPVHRPDGSLAYMVGISQDISREQEMQQAQAMASALASEMEDFVSLAAHDLRSPIANVKSLVDMVRDGFVDMGDGKLEMISMIEEISTRALALVSDVLSQAAATRAGSETRTFDLQALCDDILVTLDPANLHVLNVAKARLKTDYVVLQIVLRNLIDNAIKHSEAESIRLDVSIDAVGSERIAITVCDDGAGFADPAVAFLDGGRLTADSGFGLLGVRRLLRVRDGDISARHPASGRGAEIRFELPGEIVRTFEDPPRRISLAG